MDIDLLGLVPEMYCIHRRQGLKAHIYDHVVFRMPLRFACNIDKYSVIFIPWEKQDRQRQKRRYRTSRMVFKAPVKPTVTPLYIFLMYLVPSFRLTALVIPVHDIVTTYSLCSFTRRQKPTKTFINVAHSQSCFRQKSPNRTNWGTFQRWSHKEDHPRQVDLDISWANAARLPEWAP